MYYDIPMLRSGSRGPYVKTVQEVLNLWFQQSRKPLVPDGVFGPNTDAAVRAFQVRFGLVPDGIVGPLTHAALFPLHTYLLDVYATPLDGGAAATGTSVVHPRLGFGIPGNLLGQVAANPPSPPPSPGKQPSATPGGTPTTLFVPTPPGSSPVKTLPPGPGIPMPVPAPSHKDVKKQELQVTVGAKVDLPKKTLAATHPPSPSPAKPAIVFSVQGVLKNPPSSVGPVVFSASAQPAQGKVTGPDGQTWNFSVTAKATRSQDLVKLGDWGRLKVFGEAGVKAAINGSSPSASASVAGGAGVSVNLAKKGRITLDINGQTQLEGTLDQKGLNLHNTVSGTGAVTFHFP
jgi:hypothetical protein